MIRMFDYRRTLAPIENEVFEAMRRVLRSGILLLGPETEAFEKEFADFVGARFCVAVSSGTTALHLALRALDIGSGNEVVTVPNTCVPTVAGIRLTGANIELVDVREDDLMLDPEQLPYTLNERTGAIVPVHLWGWSADLDPIRHTAEENGLALVEDAAQACGTRYRGRHVGTFGRAGCFSFYPTKNLGTYGDAGAVITNDEALADRLRRLRMYGYDETGRAVEEGMNARIDELQAAILRVKLRHLPDGLARRRAIAQTYLEHIRNPGLRLPRVKEYLEPSWHQFVVRCADREAFERILREQAIEYAVHYPVPVHVMPAYRDILHVRFQPAVAEKAAERILSIPVHEGLEESEVEAVIKALNRV